jgi:hypothetical protein
MFHSARVMSVALLLISLLRFTPTAHAQVKVKYSDPDLQALHDLKPSPEESASLVVVGRVEKIEFEEYAKGDYTYRLYIVTLKVTGVPKGEGPKVGELLRFTARHPHERHVGLLGGGNPWIMVTDEVAWVPQVGDNVRVCLNPAVAYQAVAGRSITPEPAPAAGTPVTAVGESRLLRTEDWLAVSVALSLVTLIAGVLVGRRWGRARPKSPASGRAEPPYGLTDLNKNNADGPGVVD